MAKAIKNYIFLTLIGASVFVIIGLYNLITGDVNTGRIFIFISLIGFSASLFFARIGKKAG